MTKDEALDRLLTLAGMAALETPQYQSKYSHFAQVRWEIIKEIREILPAAGVDYSAARKRFDANIKAAQ